MESFQLLGALGAAATWLMLTILSKAIGKRYMPENAPARDALIDIVTLVMSLQIAISLGDTPLVSSIVDWLLKHLKNAEGGQSVLSIAVGGIIGVIFVIFAIKKGRKFAKFDEEAFAWRELMLFTLNSLVAIKLLPWVNDAIDKVAQYFATPVGSFVLKVVNDLFSIDF